MFDFVAVNIRAIIAEMRAADDIEDEIELDNDDAESVFYASGLPEEMQYQ